MSGYVVSADNLLLSDGTWTYSYDAENNRIGKTKGSGLETWYYTDDTIMAMSVVETLEEHGRIEQDALAARFGRKLVLDP